MGFWGLFKSDRKLNSFAFYEAEDHCFPEVFFDVSLSCDASHELGKTLEKYFFAFMHKWDKWHRYSIRYICLHKVFEQEKTVRIAVDFGGCRKAIVKALIKWLRRRNLPITSITMHSDD